VKTIIFRRDMNQLRAYCEDNNLRPTKDIVIATSSRSLLGRRGPDVKIVLLKDWQDRYCLEEQLEIESLVNRLEQEGAAITR